jgi:hypothetical protein
MHKRGVLIMLVLIEEFEDSDKGIVFDTLSESTRIEKVDKQLGVQNNKLHLSSNAPIEAVKASEFYKIHDAIIGVDMLVGKKLTQFQHTFLKSFLFDDTYKDLLIKLGTLYYTNKDKKSVHLSAEESYGFGQCMLIVSDSNVILTDEKDCIYLKRSILDGLRPSTHLLHELKVVELDRRDCDTDWILTEESMYYFNESVKLNTLEIIGKPIIHFKNNSDVMIKTLIFKSDDKDLFNMVMKNSIIMDTLICPESVVMELFNYGTIDYNVVVPDLSNFIDEDVYKHISSGQLRLMNRKWDDEVFRTMHNMKLNFSEEFKELYGIY